MTSRVYYRFWPNTIGARAARPVKGGRLRQNCLKRQITLAITKIRGECNQAAKGDRLKIGSRRSSQVRFLPLALQMPSHFHSILSH